MRLDKALVWLVPGLGRRSVRRFLQDREVRVDGQHRPVGFRVTAGQCIVFRNPAARDECESLRSDLLHKIQVAAQNEDFAALIKPAGVHSESLGHSCVLSVESILPILFPEAVPVLLNRLDQPVSGLVLAALHEKAAREYAGLQDQGRVRKGYLAVVRGDLTGERLVRAALDTAKRRKVRVVGDADPDALRWTRVFPIGRDVATDATLVRVEIRKGRRHQIRAHLASIGHPVLYDPVYGAGPDRGWIALHHERVELPGFEVCAKPDWRELVGENLPCMSASVGPVRGEV
ncbi:MAG: RluA family pseudouridine synthase [Desulfovibrionales bacterium]|nr:MAG: RluA family pseudouridine synthase [Desulfovibrionales bacterium]